jgi:aminomethyltransferase
MTGLVLEGRGIMRAHQAVRQAGSEGEGETTSGGYSPTMEKSIAFARVPASWQGEVEVQIRNRWVPARMVPLPFVRKGKIKV